jgi:HEAT repeat protein
MWEPNGAKSWFVHFVRFVLAIAVLTMQAASGQTLEDWLKQLHDPEQKKRFEAVAALRSFPPDENLVAALVERLKDQSLTVRDLSAEALGAFGIDAPRVVPALMELLEEPEWLARMAAIQALRKFGPEGAPAGPKLASLFRDPDLLIRLNAVRTLGAIVGVDSPESLHAASLDKRTEVRSAALKDLSRLSESSATYLPEFSHALEDAHDDVREAAADAIARLGPAAEGGLPALIAASRKAEYRNGGAFIRALLSVSAEHRESVVPLLIEALHDTGNSYGGRRVAAMVLGDIGPPARSALPALTKASQDGPDWFRKAIEDALVQLSPGLNVATREGFSGAIAMLASDDRLTQERARISLAEAGPAAVPPLLALLRTAPTEAVRLAALRALADNFLKGGCAPAAVPLLTGLVSTGESTAVQSEAARILGFCAKVPDPAAAAAVEVLMRALSSPQLRDNALVALGQFRERAVGAVPAMQDILQQSLNRQPPDLRTASVVVHVLGTMGPAGQSTSPLIIRVLDDRDYYLHQAAVDALGNMRAAAALPFLAKDLHSPMEQVRERASGAISQIFADAVGRDHADEVIPQLKERLKDSAPAVRANVLNALARLGPEIALRPMQEAVSDSNAWVRLHALMGLGTLAAQADGDWVKKTVLPVLIHSLDDADPNVASQAALSLQVFGPSAAAALPALRRAALRLTGDQHVTNAIRLIEAKQ